MRISLHLEGERALFARPEFQHDLISYDLITPHAARGVLDTIFGQPALAWVVDAIHILHPVRRECVEESGRRMLMLRHVGYVVEAHLALGRDAMVEANDAAMVERARQSAPAIHLGHVRCPGIATFVTEGDPPRPIEPLPAFVDYGWLLHGLDRAPSRRPRYFRAEAYSGRIRVPSADSPLLFS